MSIPDRAERIDRALEPLAAQLLRAGVRLNSSRAIRLLHEEDYPIGLPIILDHLRMPYDDLPRSVIAGALCYTKNVHTRAIWPEIADLYSDAPNRAKPFNDDAMTLRDSSVKLTLANALLRLYEPKRLAALVELVRDKSNGETRVILLEPLLRVKTRRKGMLDILLDLKADPELATELSARGIV